MKYSLLFILSFSGLLLCSFWEKLDNLEDGEIKLERDLGVVREYIYERDVDACRLKLKSYKIIDDTLRLRFRFTDGYRDEYYIKSAFNDEGSNLRLFSNDDFMHDDWFVYLDKSTKEVKLTGVGSDKKEFKSIIDFYNFSERELQFEDFVTILNPDFNKENKVSINSDNIAIVVKLLKPDLNIKLNHEQISYTKSMVFTKDYIVKDSLILLFDIEQGSTILSKRFKVNYLK
ncbi:MAG: hypothetical protein JXR48_15195 [Candidatus Delongbacteria bacterium]|nr:hypothetical protein [Candidatus Delongbacteria bacterium]MBN2836303.1 hypothetical protein [Candidatus Delongbacteria bacterium]